MPSEIARGTFLEEPTVVPKALFLCVEDLSGKRYAHARDRWEIRMPSANEADLLDLSPGAAVLHVVHSAYAADDSVLKVSESVWPADRVTILDEYDISRDPDASPLASEV